MDMACHPSYPLNSENASPPGTFTVYLSCAEMATPASTTAKITASGIFRRNGRIVFLSAACLVRCWLSLVWVIASSFEPLGEPSGSNCGTTEVCLGDQQ